MKKITGILFLTVLSMAVLCLSLNSMAAGGFKKYENFENYPTGNFVDNDKFFIGESCTDQNVAGITIEDHNGSRQLKFTYNMVTPDTSCYLFFNQCPERIVSIKADVTVASCGLADQDCRARIAWHRGINSEDDKYIWEAVQVRPNNPDYNQGGISSWADLLDQNDNFNALGQLYWANFTKPIASIGETYTIVAIFNNPTQTTVTVKGQGTITYKVQNKMGNPIDIFKAIGVRVGSGSPSGETNGEFVTYFDNIEIKTKGVCDNKSPKAKAIYPKKNLVLDACWLDITFPEPMDSCCWDVATDPAWGGIAATSWSDDRKTFSISRDTCGGPLSAKTKLNFIVNPNGDGGIDYFRDLTGNPAKTSKLSTRTVK